MDKMKQGAQFRYIRGSDCQIDYDTKLISPYSKEYHFFIQMIWILRSPVSVSYYLLARPNSDTAVYTRY